MKRRSLLRMTAGACVAGGSMLSGCLGVLELVEGACSTSFEWCYGANVDIAAVRDGVVYGRTSTTGSPAERPNEVIALDAETGDRRWRYGPETESGAEYKALTVENGIYFTRCVDEDCWGVRALDLDGEERWSHEFVTSYHRPLVAHDTAYVAADSGLVHAIDALTGEKRWDYQVPTGSPTIVGATDAVYATTNYAVFALTRDRGTERWRYETDEQLVLDASISDGIAYVVTAERVIAIADGAAQWDAKFDPGTAGVGTEIVGTAAGRLLVFTEGEDVFRLHAFDVETGARTWTTDEIERRRGEWEPNADAVGEIAYVGAQTLRALDVETGDERWNEAVDGGQIKSVTVTEDGSVAEHEVFVHAGDTQLASFAPDGEQTWERFIDEPVQDYLVGEYVLVMTEGKVHAMAR